LVTAEGGRSERPIHNGKDRELATLFDYIDQPYLQTLHGPSIVYEAQLETVPGIGIINDAPLKALKIAGGVIETAPVKSHPVCFVVVYETHLDAF
jgi:hypothetical protein